MDKVPYGVRAVLNNSSLRGIHDTLGNIVQTEESYALMLEVALGSGINFVIVDDEAAVKRGKLII